MFPVQWLYFASENQWPPPPSSLSDRCHGELHVPPPLVSTRPRWEIKNADSRRSCRNTSLFRGWRRLQRHHVSLMQQGRRPRSPVKNRASCSPLSNQWWGDVGDVGGNSGGGGRREGAQQLFKDYRGREYLPAFDKAPQTGERSFSFFGLLQKQTHLTSSWAATKHPHDSGKKKTVGRQVRADSYTNKK